MKKAETLAKNALERKKWAEQALEEEARKSPEILGRGKRIRPVVDYRQINYGRYTKGSSKRRYRHNNETVVEMKMSDIDELNYEEIKIEVNEDGDEIKKEAGEDFNELSCLKNKNYSDHALSTHLSENQ